MKRQTYPIVAIVGRPNVGKSTLFNRIAGRRKANVHDVSGLTRDRNYALTEWNGKNFLLVDTGGYELMDADLISSSIREQVLMAVEEADSIIFVTDVHATNHPGDREILTMLRRADKPFFLSVNKCDHDSLQNQAYDFSSLGVDSLFPISAEHGLEIGSLLDAVTESMPEIVGESADPGGEVRVAICGRQNVGKSTLLNKILGRERVIAGPVAGTTRDAVDVPYTLGERRYLLIDTAGIRRRGKVEKGTESLSVMSSIMSIQRSDVAILLLDASSGVTAQDTHIGGYIQDSGRAVILAVNKWDMLEKDTSTAGAFAKKMRQEFNFLSFAPIVFISARTGQRVRNLFTMIDEVMSQYTRRFETSSLNDALAAILRHHQPAFHKGGQLKIKYITQTGIAPPTFTLFVNNPRYMHFSYRRYLQNQLRLHFGLSKCPVRLKLRKKSG